MFGHQTKKHHTSDTFVETVKKHFKCAKTFKPKQSHPK